MQHHGFWRFNRQAFGLFLFILGIEAVIAIAATDQFIRPFVGDVLVVIMICFFLHAFIANRLPQIVVGTFGFACGVELLQFLDLIGKLGWRNSLAAHLTLGSTFDWLDILAYTIGCGLVLGAHHLNWIGSR